MLRQCPCSVQAHPGRQIRPPAWPAAARAPRAATAAAPPSIVMNSRLVLTRSPSSARARRVGGTSMPSVFAALEVEGQVKFGGLENRQVAVSLLLRIRPAKIPTSDRRPECSDHRPGAACNREFARLVNGRAYWSEPSAATILFRRLFKKVRRSPQWTRRRVGGWEKYPRSPLRCWH